MARTHPLLHLHVPSATLTQGRGLSSDDGAKLHRFNTAQGLVPAGATDGPDKSSEGWKLMVYETKGDCFPMTQYQFPNTDFSTQASNPTFLLRP